MDQRCGRRHPDRRRDRGPALVNGRVAGISGILGGAIEAQRGFWRWTFLAGLVAAGFLAQRFDLAQVGSSTGEIPASIVTLVIAGALVGFGTAVGSGCTSGHGVSGISSKCRHARSSRPWFSSPSPPRLSTPRRILAFWSVWGIRMGAITALIFGLIFGAGLVISGMTDPNLHPRFSRCNGKLGPHPRIRHGGGHRGRLAGFRDRATG